MTTGSTLDSMWYLGIKDRENTEDIGQLLGSMALYYHIRLQELMLAILGTIPAELEDGLYRLKCMCLSEARDLPFEEAVSVYAHLKTVRLEKDSSDFIPVLPEAEEIRALLPVIPFLPQEGDNVF